MSAQPLVALLLAPGVIVDSIKTDGEEQLLAKPGLGVPAELWQHADASASLMRGRTITVTLRAGEDSEPLAMRLACAFSR